MLSIWSFPHIAAENGNIPTRVIQENRKLMNLAGAQSEQLKSNSRRRWKSEPYHRILQHGVSYRPMPAIQEAAGIVSGRHFITGSTRHFSEHPGAAAIRCFVNPRPLFNGHVTVFGYHVAIWYVYIG